MSARVLITNQLVGERSKSRQESRKVGSVKKGISLAEGNTDTKLKGSEIEPVRLNIVKKSTRPRESTVCLDTGSEVPKSCAKDERSRKALKHTKQCPIIAESIDQTRSTLVQTCHDDQDLTDQEENRRRALQRVIKHRRSSSQLEQVNSTVDQRRSLEMKEKWAKKHQESQRRRAEIYAINNLMRVEQQERISWFIEEQTRLKSKNTSSSMDSE